MKSCIGKFFLIRATGGVLHGNPAIPGFPELRDQCWQVRSSSWSWECGFFSSHSGRPCFFR